MTRLLKRTALILAVLALTSGAALAQTQTETQPAAQTLPATTQVQPDNPQPAAQAQTEAQPQPQAEPEIQEQPAAQPVTPAPQAAVLEPLYRINGGDTLHISVYGEKDLDKDVAVEPDGGIAFPLVGNMNARGLTLAELSKKVADALRAGNMLPNVTDPEVTVSLVKSSGNSFSVIGQVKQPGTFVTDTQVDVMQALSLAGGLTPFASKSRILVLRRDGSGVQSKIPFDYSSVEDGEQLNMNIVLQGGDVVVVPQAGLGF